MVMCWAPDCKHYNVRETCKFFSFPKDMEKRNKWIRLLRRNEKPGPGAFVCSCHFRDGIKNNGPEIFAHNKAKRQIFLVTSPEVQKRKRKSDSPSKTGSTQLVDVRIQDTSISELEGSLETTAPTTSSTPTSSRENVTLAAASFSAYSSTVLETENYFLKQEIEESKKIIKYMTGRFCYENIKDDDNLVVLYTGLPNGKIFEALYNLKKDLEIKYYLGWNVTKLKRIDQLLLALMKLRLNSPHLDLAQRFRISSTAVTNVVLTFVHLLYECLYEQLMKSLPSRQKNMSCLPSCFNNFTNCRIVLDCTEIFTVVSRKSMKRQRLTYSTYKHHNTYKGLVGVAPNGVITFISDLYVGSTSDKKIVVDSGILQQLETGDLILADKGFLIKDILPQGVNLNIPPFLRTPQFTEEQVRRTENIARARVHVERAIRRMKCYRILSFMPESLCPYGDVIFKTVAALTNLQYPLIKEVEELFIND